MIDVFHINSYFITNGVHSEMVSKLDASGLSQVIYIPVQKKSDINKNHPGILDNSRLIYSHCFDPFDKKLWPLKMFKIWCDFKKVIKVNPCKIIHAHTLIVNGFIAYVANRKWGIPYLVTIRNTDINLYLKRYPYFRGLARKILFKANAIITISPAYANIQLKRFLSQQDFQILQKKIVVIPSGINDFWIENKSLKEKRCPIPTIIFIGRVDSNKNLETLINACEILNNNQFRIKLSVVGEGPLLPAIRAKTFATEIDFKGFISDKYQLKEIMHNSDILAVASFTESFGLVYPEAMSQGLPIIYTKDQGFDGFFPNGEVGYSADPSNALDIAEKIRSIFCDYFKFSANSYKNVANFSWLQIIEKYYNLYLKQNNILS